MSEAPNFINSARVLVRSAEESGPFHNFPGSFDSQILGQGTRTATPDFYSSGRYLLSNDAVMYELPGSINGVERYISNRHATFDLGKHRGDHAPLL